jgi:putative membrane protein
MITFEKDEKILYQCKPDPKVVIVWVLTKLFVFLILIGYFMFSFYFSRRVSVGASLAMGFFLWLFLILFIILFIYLFFLRKTYEYYITNQRIIFKGGLLLRKVRSVPFHKITDVEKSQHILETILGIWKVNVFTPGTGSLKAEIVFSGLKDPDTPERILKDLLKAYKSTGP